MKVGIGEIVARGSATPENRREGGAPEYAARVIERVETIQAEVAALGGQKAVEAYHFTTPGISYAGELPSSPEPRPLEGFTGFPTLP